MDQFKCIKCNKIFGKKHHLINHLNKKFKCDELDIKLISNAPESSSTNITSSESNTNIDENKIFKCEMCNMSFVKKYNLERHLNGRCKAKNTIDEKFNENKMVNVDDLDVDDNTKLILSLFINQNKIILENIKNELRNELKKELEEQMGKLNTKSSKKTINNTNTNTNCNNTTNNTTNQNTLNTLLNNNSNNTINIIAHGNEDISKIELDAIMTCLSTFKHKEIIPNITKHIYLNDTKPENQNFYVTDMSRNKCKFHDGKKWQIGKSSDKITKIFDNVHNVLTDPFEKENIEKTTAFIKANPKKYNPQFIKVANHYLKSLYDDDDKESIEDKAKVLEELKLIFFNNKEEIMRIKLKDEKKTKT
jgi:uncharacterized C2H2 Zn-finger protein